MNENWTDRLSEYIDGELDGVASQMLERRLADDADLRQTLDELRAVKVAAAAEIDAAPTSDLWPAIRARIGTQPAARSRRLVTITIPQFAAAAGIMMLLGVGLASLGGDGRLGSVGGDPLAGIESPADARFVSADDPARYSGFVEDLERRIEAGRGMLDAETIRVLEQSLAKIDHAINQAQAALENDPNNTYLNQHLASARARKLRLLENATELVASST
ncbi:MAG: hypothetical protein OEM23_02650 [Gemmatimonadota bacterium]|nr:hypothetical protein [Gemmatimonadota bacterium]